MKRVLKIVLPLLLILALLCGAAWYFLIYEDILDDSFFVAHAEKACASEQYDKAIRWYQYALNKDAKSETYLALADAYVQSGNCSRAEYTLACAIVASPEDPALYSALSALYVRQDKLLDAENLLTNVHYESVQAALNDLRPAAPVLDLEPGEYDDYLELTIFYDGGTCYVSTDGDYPSTADDIYDGPISLPAGVTQIQAMVVSDDGLVSTLVTGTYTIGHVDEEVTFTDMVLEAAIRDALAVGAYDTIMTSDLWQFQSLIIPEGVQSLDDLRWFDELQTLVLQNASDLDLSPIAAVTSLRTLDLSGTAVSAADLDALGTMTWLGSLDLSGCGLSSVEALANMTALTALDLSNNSLGSVSALAGLTALETLDLSGNVLDIADSLSGLVNLTTLSLSGNPIGNVTPLRGLTALEDLDISNCDLQTIQPLASLTSLRLLNAADNDLQSVAALSACTVLEELDLSGNQLTEVSVLAELEALLNLTLDNNQLTALPAFSPSSPLVFFSATHNQLTDISGLTGLAWLNYVDLDYNALTSLDALSSCTRLVQVNAFENPLTDVSALTGNNIVVNYSPLYTAE